MSETLERPLSAEQQDIYFDLERHPSVSIHRAIGWVELGRDMHPNTWNQAVREVTRADPVFRSEVVLTPAGLVQRASLQTASSGIPLADSPIPLPEAGHEAVENWVKAWFSEHHSVGFFHWLLRDTNDIHYSVFHFPHLFLDGISYRLFLERVDAHYQALQGRNSPVESSTSIFDIEEQRDVTPNLATTDFWRNRLHGVNTLVFGTPRTETENHAVERTSLTKQESQAVLSYCQRAGVTPAAFFLSLYATVLQRFRTEPGALRIDRIHRRRDRSSARVLGCLYRVLPHVFSEDELRSPAVLVHVMRQVQSSLLASRRHLGVSVQQLEALEASRGARVYFNFYDFATVCLLGAEREIQSYLVYPEREVHLVVNARDGGFQLNLFYNPRTLDGHTISARIRQVALQAATGARTVGDLDWLLEAERSFVKAQRDHQFPSPTETVLERWKHHVRARPEAIALRFGDQCVSHGELERRVEWVRARLYHHGVRRRDFVGVWLEPGIEQVVALLGVLAAGASYAPIDVTEPTARAERFLSEIGASLLITGPRGAPEDFTVCRAIRVEDLLVPASYPEAESSARLDDPAYSILTSGSSGKPKAVLVSHRNLAALFAAATQEFDFRADDVWAYLHSYAFDFSVWELWGALYYGGSLVIVPRCVTLAPDDLLEELDRTRVTVLNQTPSAFAPLLDQLTRRIAHRPETLGSLRCLLFGGETLHPERLEPWFRSPLAAQVQVVNLYGITETTVHVTSRRIVVGDCRRSESRAAGSPIGAPLPHLRIELVDDEGRIVPDSVSGEIWVGGAGVALGYQGADPDAARRFRDDPFCPGQRIYVTGDRARRVNGDYEFLGRKDDQVQLRGYRVECREVEVALEQCSAVRTAVVLPMRDGAEETLLACVQLRRGANTDAPRLRTELRERVPEHMTTLRIVFVDALPRTQNSKLDRRALLELVDRIEPHPAVPSGEPREHQATNTSWEQTIARAFAEALQRPHVASDDDFFALGGHSLRAVTLMADLARTTGVDVRLRTIFQNPTPRSLARALDQEVNRPTRSEPEPRVRPTRFPLTSAQRRVFAIQTLNPSCTAYHFHGSLHFDGRLDLPSLQRALDWMIERHEALRSTFELHDEDPVQVVHPPHPARVSILEIDVQPEEQAARELRSHVRRLLDRPFELDRLPLVEWVLVRLGPERAVLIHREHHLTHDGWSFARFVQELLVGYTAALEGHDVPLAPPRLHVGDIAEMETRWLTTTEATTQRAYWKQQLAGASFTIPLPYDQAPHRDTVFTGRVFRHQLPVELTRAVSSLARTRGTTPFTVLVGAFALLLHAHSEENSLCIGSAVSNRTTAGSESVLGMLLNNIVLRFFFDEEMTFRGFLDAVHRTVREGILNAQLPYEEIKQAAGEGAAGDPVFFSTYDGPTFENRVPGARVHVTASLNETTSKFPLNVVAVSVPDGSSDPKLEMLWEHGDVFAPNTIRRMGHRYVRLLQQAVLTPDQHLGEYRLTDRADAAFFRRFNHTQRTYPRDATVPELFASVAAAYPEQLAVVSGERCLSYRELDAMSRRIAHRLLERRLPPRTIIGLSLPRGPRAIATMLAILRTDAAYFPVDARDPVERLRALLDRAGVQIMITSRQGPELPGIHTLFIEELSEGEPDDDATSATALLPVDLNAETTAYVMATSGSTGTPKLVEATHRGVVRLVRGIDYVTLNPSCRVFHLAPLAFDASTFEIWGALLNGATLVSYPDDLPSLDDLRSVLADNQVTTLWLTASLFHAIVDTDPSLLAPVRELIVGGEPLSVASIHRAHSALPHIQLINGYGPTENTTFSCCHRIDRTLSPRAVSVPLGRPIANSTAYVLDRHGGLAPVGASGEIWVGGDGLTRECHGPGLTNHDGDAEPARWVRQAAAEGELLYRTGDRGRIDARGLLVYEGRLDEQVKVRGFRVEPRELERAALQCAGVTRSCVLTRTHDRTGVQLLLFVVADGAVSLNPAGLKEELRRRLPQFLIPTTIHLVRDFPLTSNGKVDKAALLEAADDAGTDDSSQQVSLVARSAREQLLLDLVRESLGGTSLGPDDDFFDRGGNSLLAFQLLGRLQSLFGVSIPVRSLYPSLTVRSLDTELERLLTRAEPERAMLRFLSPIKPKGSKAPLMFVPGGDGGQGALIVYARLLRHMAKEQPFFGFIATNDADLASPHASVEAMAAAYVEELRKVQGSGPYHLAGECVGGVVAFEMARQLRAAGQTIGTLTLLDAVPSSPARAARHRLWVACTALHALGARLVSQLESDQDRARCRWAVSQLPFPAEKIAARPAPAWIDYQTILLRYRPAPYTGPLDLIVSQSEARHGIDAAWRPFVRGRLRVHIVPGDHSSYLRDYAEHTGRTLQSILDGSPTRSSRLHP